jgi:hypothetical protein
MLLELICHKDGATSFPYTNLDNHLRPKRSDSLAKKGVLAVPALHIVVKQISRKFVKRVSALPKSIDNHLSSGIDKEKLNIFFFEKVLICASSMIPRAAYRYRGKGSDDNS